MSVFTTVSRDDLVAFLQHYSVGGLVDFEGITTGVENTNYFVDTDAGRWVLTLFERQRHEDLPYFLDLMAHLADNGVPSPRPVADREGAFLRRLNDRPAALVQRLTGASVSEPAPAHCAEVGRVLADLHRVGGSFQEFRASCRGPRWWRETGEALLPRLSEEDGRLLREELDFQSRFRHARLPSGVIHADLFRDNVLFDGERLSGLIDFYFACNDVLLYDLAVTVNDWCVQPDGAFDDERLHALLHAYGESRPLSDDESDAWPVLLRAAALRFWLSRAYDWHFPRDGEMIDARDPEPFKQLLLRHRRQRTSPRL